MLVIKFIGITPIFEMATEDFFVLVREGDSSKIKEYIYNLRDLIAIENALNSNPTLAGLVNDNVSKFCFMGSQIRLIFEHFLYRIRKIPFTMPHIMDHFNWCSYCLARAQKLLIPKT